MTFATIRATVLTATVMCAISSADAVTYTAQLLHPDNFLDTNGAGASNTAQVGSGVTVAFNGPHALLWSGTPASYVDLNPTTGFTSSYAVAAGTTQQAGYGSGSGTGGNVHALLWSSTAASVVDLNPADLDASYAIGISGGSQVGYGFTTTDFLSHALVWNGTAASKVDLNPANFTESFGNGISNSTQVGYGYGPATGDNNHALLWSGSAASAVDLNPTGFTESYANAVISPPGGGSIQVGSGAGPATNAEAHALLWASTAASAIDLHPANGFAFSEALGASTTGQVGDGYGDATNGAYHALFWNGTAASVIDLHSNLLADTGFDFVASQAFSIADDGTIVGTATDDGFHTYAILWTPQSSGSESGVAADYNNDGKVDAADYVTWRHGNTPLHNEVATIGSNSPQDYVEWRSRFGNGTSIGSTLGSQQVPEPAGLFLCGLAAIVSLMVRRYRQR